MTACLTCWRCRHHNATRLLMAGVISFARAEGWTIMTAHIRHISRQAAKSWLFAAAVLAAAPAADAQTAKRTVLEQIDVPGSAYTTIVAMTEIQPNGRVERHIHPGTEITYVLEGGGDMFIAGKPVMHVTAGDHWQVPAGLPHYLLNGPKPTRLLVTYVLEKGKPLAIPAPETPAAH